MPGNVQKCKSVWECSDFCFEQCLAIQFCMKTVVRCRSSYFVYLCTIIYCLCLYALSMLCCCTLWSIFLISYFSIIAVWVALEWPLLYSIVVSASQAYVFAFLSTLWNRCFDISSGWEEACRMKVFKFVINLSFSVGVLAISFVQHVYTVCISLFQCSEL